MRHEQDRANAEREEFREVREFNRTFVPPAQPFIWQLVPALKGEFVLREEYDLYQI